MHVAQSGIFALGTGSHSYLEFDLHAQGNPLTLVQVMASLGEPRMTTGGVNLVVGFRPSLWARVAPGEMPAGVTDFEQEVRGPQSHVSRTVIEVNGVEQHIFRRNTPFGTATKHGTMFIGFSCEQQRLTRMLARMAGAEDGIRDALTRYTTALSGAYYFVPSVEALRRFSAADD